jgi:hypothetical protein
MLFEYCVPVCKEYGWRGNDIDSDRLKPQVEALRIEIQLVLSCLAE